ncbi:MAG: AAA family ATPase, partial [Planctomycetes bacterium]|nr:AAA family ATPase [Planctomycetota bacterium]
MKILKLTLRAFGPFSGAVLDLSQGRQGLHLVYGPNEAGKSSALRAVGNVLYGIPVRSPDDFVHPYTKMRVGAVLQHSDGSELELVRRKGNRNTLRGANDSTPLDDAVLDRFLTGVDDDLFRTMFGIDHHGLRRGGKEIVRGGGRIGEILFAAGSGVADLRQVQESLQSETDALFKPTGRNQEINRAVRLLLEARTELKGLQLSSDEWSRHQQSLKKAQERRESLEGDLRQDRQEQNRLGRIRDALSAILRWRQLQGQLEPYKDATLLPGDFGERRGNVLTQRQIAQTGRDEARQAIERVDEELRTLTVSEDVLEQAEAIEGLRERLGSHRKAMADLPRLTTSKEIAERDAREILEKLGRPAALDQAKGMRLPADKAVLIQNLGSRQHALAEKFSAARKQRDRIGRRVSETEKRLADLDA